MSVETQSLVETRYHAQTGRIRKAKRVGCTNTTNMEMHINFVAVLVAVVACFLLGALWFTVLFGRAWAREMHMDPNDPPPKGTMMKGMIFMVIGNFFFAFVLAHNIAAWSFVPGIDPNAPIPNILMSALFTWLGFYFPIELGATVWERHSWKLFAINSGYHICMLLVASSVLTLMK